MNAGRFDCVWFQGIKYFKSIFNEGEVYAISAKPVLTRYGHLQFTHPDFDRLESEESESFMHTGKIIPFYTVPKELKATNIGDNSLRRIMYKAVTECADQIKETLPGDLILENNLLSKAETIKNIHFPPTFKKLKEAQFRLKYDEIFFLECLVALKRHNIKEIARGIKFTTDKETIRKFLDTLPFSLTPSQLTVLSEIRKDLESKKPMNRLLQGDVGSGKTIVALIAMLIVTQNKYQCALMVPTEILAVQHFNKLSDFLKNFDLKIALLIGSTKLKERTILLNDIKVGKIDIVIGTHALIEDTVDFHRLGFVVIDEQHRFGVAQRSKLIKKGIAPDLLIMTATPIPRTMTMTLWGDLDVSVITNKPANRKDIKTYIRGDKSLPDIYSYIVEKAREGIQSFIVYPLVEESEKLELKAAEEYYSQLKNDSLSSLNVGLLHGKMKWQEKEKVMLKFSNREYDVLVSTTVIEVGIDIPDANIILINDAYRFGLSQLHQLRGRVGRSNTQAYCILVTKDEYLWMKGKAKFNFEYMSDTEIEKNKSVIRLNAMKEFNDGFKLAEIDLKLRGPGDIFGTRQSGFPPLQFINLYEDYEIIEKAKTDAFNIITNDPHLNSSDNFIIKSNLKNNYSNHIYYSLIP